MFAELEANDCAEEWCEETFEICVSNTSWYGSTGIGAKINTPVRTIQNRCSQMHEKELSSFRSFEAYLHQADASAELDHDDLLQSLG